jgi:hypothetical protein
VSDVVPLPLPDVPLIPVVPIKPLESIKKKSKRFTGDRIAPARAYAIRALVDSGFPIEEIARREHLSKNTVYAIKKDDRFDPQRVERIKGNLSAHFYDTAHRSLEGVTDEKIEKSSGLQLVTMAAISTDKARLIEGKATARTEYMSAEDQSVQDEIARLEGELTQWKDGDIVNAVGIEDQRTTPVGQHAPTTVDKGADSAT